MKYRIKTVKNNDNIKHYAQVRIWGIWRYIGRKIIAGPQLETDIDPGISHTRYSDAKERIKEYERLLKIRNKKDEILTMHTPFDPNQ